MENLYLIVGLGNPGTKYARTRHNAGFLVVEQLAARWGAGWAMEKRFSARLAWAEAEGRRVLLCQPQTYMNSSGEAVGELCGFYRVQLGRLLVVVDDADLELGLLRMRPNGSSGGHHGLESIETVLGTRDYARLRVGIGRQGPVREITGHVLGSFDAAESARMEKVLTVAADQAQAWLTAGIQKAMSRYNGAVDAAENERKEQ